MAAMTPSTIERQRRPRTLYVVETPGTLPPELWYGGRLNRAASGLWLREQKDLPRPGELTTRGLRKRRWVEAHESHVGPVDEELGVDRAPVRRIKELADPEVGSIGHDNGALDIDRPQAQSAAGKVALA